MSRLNRRRDLAALPGAAGLVVVPAVLRAQGQSVPVAAWNRPTCGGCQDWIAHLESNGFRDKVNDVGNCAARARRQIPAKLGACPTAWVGRDAIEGHVPASQPAWH